MAEAAAETSEVSTVAETNESTEAVEHPEPAQDATGDAGDSAESTEQPAKETAESADDELRRLRRENRKRERTQQKLYGELEVTKAELARRSASPKQGEQESSSASQPDPVAVAREIVAVERFNERCNDIAEDGKKAYSREFMTAWNAIASEIPITDPKTGKATPFFESITDLDNAAAVIHHIGNDSDLIDELADLTGRKLDRRLALIEAELKVKPKVSTAAIPIMPIKQRSSAGEPDPRDTSAWIKWRQKTAARR